MAKSDKSNGSPSVIESTGSEGFSQTTVTGKAGVIDKHIGQLISASLGFAMAGEPTDEFRVTLRIERINT